MVRLIVNLGLVCPDYNLNRHGEAEGVFVNRVHLCWYYACPPKVWPWTGWEMESLLLSSFHLPPRIAVTFTTSFCAHNYNSSGDFRHFLLFFSSSSSQLLFQRPAQTTVTIQAIQYLHDQTTLSDHIPTGDVEARGGRHIDGSWGLAAETRTHRLGRSYR